MSGLKGVLHHDSCEKWPWILCRSDWCKEVINYLSILKVWNSLILEFFWSYFSQALLFFGQILLLISYQFIFYLLFLCIFNCNFLLFFSSYLFICCVFNTFSLILFNFYLFSTLYNYPSSRWSSSAAKFAETFAWCIDISAKCARVTDYWQLACRGKRAERFAWVATFLLKFSYCIDCSLNTFILSRD